MLKSYLTTPRCLLLILLVCTCCFIPNSRLLPVDIMECRTLATAREMVESHNWLVPTLNGQPRLEKPPLPTWGAALVESVSPHDIGAQRLLTSLLACLWVLFSFEIVRLLSLSRINALWCGLIMASSYSIMFLARNATWDIWCHALCAIGIWAYIKATLRSGPSWGWMTLAGLAMGLSFMSKGPISLYTLFLPFLIGYHIVYRPSMKGKWGALTLMILTCVIVSTWWYLYILVFAQDQAHYVLHKETTAWISHSVRPWYYYWSFFKETGIWCPLVLAALGFALYYPKLRCFPPLRLAIVWTLETLICLSLFPEKKARYLLPIMMPSAMLTGCYIYALLSRLKLSKVEYYVYQGISILLMLLCIGIAFMISFNPLRMDFSRTHAQELLYWMVPMAVGLFYCLRLRRPDWLMPAICVLIMIGASLFGIRLVIPALAQQNKESLYELRNNPKAFNLAYYAPNTESLRPEVIYAAGQVIRPINPSDTTEIKTHLPFIFITSQGLKPMHEFDMYHIQYLGAYDENWKLPGQSGYKNELHTEAWLVTP